MANRKNEVRYLIRGFKWPLIIVALLLWIFIQSHAHAFILNVVDPNGGLLPAGYRWLVEEDTTHHIIPGEYDPDTTLSLNFHKSYAPVIASGDNTDTNIVVDLNKRYFVSVLPFRTTPPSNDYTIGGAPVAAG